MRSGADTRLHRILEGICPRPSKFKGFFKLLTRIELRVRNPFIARYVITIDRIDRYQVIFNFFTLQDTGSSSEQRLARQICQTRKRHTILDYVLPDSYRELERASFL